MDRAAGRVDRAAVREEAGQVVPAAARVVVVKVEAGRVGRVVDKAGQVAVAAKVARVVVSVEDRGGPVEVKAVRAVAAGKMADCQHHRLSSIRRHTACGRILARTPFRRAAVYREPR